MVIHNYRKPFVAVQRIIELWLQFAVVFMVTLKVFEQNNLYVNVQVNNTIPATVYHGIVSSGW